MNRKEHIPERIAFEIPNHKFQIPNKSQSPISNDRNKFCFKFGIWFIGVYLVFGAWDLVFFLNAMPHTSGTMQFCN